ncbi:MAG: membrane protein [bacterium]|jgi:membrane protein
MNWKRGISLSSKHIKYPRLQPFVFLWKIFREKNISSLAQSLAYTTITSIVPIITIFFFVLGRFTQTKEAKMKITAFISEYFFPEAVSQVFDQLQKIEEHSFAFGVIGIPTLLIACIILFIKMDDCINEIWEINKSREWLKNGFGFFLLIFLSPILLVLAFSIPTYLNTLPYYQQIVQFSWVSSFFSQLVPVLASAIGLYVLYLYIPSTSVQKKASIIAALISAVLLQISHSLVNYYLKNFTKFDVIYGSLAIVPIFLIWIYVVWLVVLNGAAITFMIQFYAHSNFISRKGVHHDESTLITVIYILIYLIKEFQYQGVAPGFDQIQQNLRINRKKLQDLLDILHKEELITKFQTNLDKGHYMTCYQPAFIPTKIFIRHLIPLFYRNKDTAVFENSTNQFLNLLGIHSILKIKDISLQDIVVNSHTHLEIFDPDIIQELYSQPTIDNPIKEKDIDDSDSKVILRSPIQK